MFGKQTLLDPPSSRSGTKDLVQLASHAIICLELIITFIVYMRSAGRGLAFNSHGRVYNGMAPNVCRLKPHGICPHS